MIWELKPLQASVHLLYEELLIAFYCDTITSDRADLTFEMVSFVTQLSSKVEGLGETHSAPENLHTKRAQKGFRPLSAM